MPTKCSCSTWANAICWRLRQAGVSGVTSTRRSVLKCRLVAVGVHLAGDDAQVRPAFADVVRNVGIGAFLQVHADVRCCIR
jgi:hypothetical protein